MGGGGWFKLKIESGIQIFFEPGFGCIPDFGAENKKSALFQDFLPLSQQDTKEYLNQRGT